MKDGIELVVDGRTFVQEPPTFDQEMHIMELVVESGFDQPITSLGLDPETNDLQHSVKVMIVHAYKSGRLFNLLGALLTEKGVEWTKERAAEYGELFRKTRDPHAKAQLHPALVAAVSAFFASASSYETTSPISSEEIGVSVRPKEKSELTQIEAGEVFRSGNMPSSSEKSHSTKKSLQQKSSRGKSVKG